MGVEWGGTPRRTPAADPAGAFSSAVWLLFAVLAAALAYAALAVWAVLLFVARALRALWRKVNR